MKKIINIVPYNPKWPDIFKIYSYELKKALNENCIAIYHVGSTSVPGLCAKPIIDIMCVVKDLKKATRTLEELGYTGKGEFNLPLRLYFSKKQPHVVHLHVVNENSGEINWNLDFQNYLRENKDARDAYANTKLSLIKENPDGFNKAVGWFSDYTTKKGEIILEIAKKAGFKDYRFVIISNYNEIQSYKKLMQINKIHFNENISHLCLYKGTEIVAAACVKFNQKNFTAIIQTIKGTNIKYENIIKEKIKEWVTFHDLKLIT